MPIAYNRTGSTGLWYYLDDAGAPLGSVQASTHPGLAADFADAGEMHAIVGQTPSLGGAFEVKVFDNGSRAARSPYTLTRLTGTADIAVGLAADGDLAYMLYRDTSASDAIKLARWNMRTRTTAAAPTPSTGNSGSGAPTPANVRGLARVPSTGLRGPLWLIGDRQHGKLLAFDDAWTRQTSQDVILATSPLGANMPTSITTDRDSIAYVVTGDTNLYAYAIPSP